METSLSATEIEAMMRQLPHWSLDKATGTPSIERRFVFSNYHATMAFVNAVAQIAHREDHHPDLWVHYGSCVVRFNTHDVQGLSPRDFRCAALVDALPQVQGSAQGPAQGPPQAPSA